MMCGSTLNRRSIMKVLKFKLGGTTAFFKKPDVNAYFYFTYGNIHKIALMGIFGAVLGYGGYNKQYDEKTEYPEFYERLKYIKVGVVPIGQKANSAEGQDVYFTKKIQTFNNTVGYANLDGNLIVNEQWLENPCWEIYLLLAGAEEEKIADYILNYKTVFIPYLGKNDHPANIYGAEIKTAEIFSLKTPGRINSLFIKGFFNTYVCEETMYSVNPEDFTETIFKYEERLPVSLESSTNQYEAKTFVYTNSRVVENETKDAAGGDLYKCGEKVVFFF